MFSLPSAPFYNSIAKIVEKCLIFKVCFMQFFIIVHVIKLVILSHLSHLDSQSEHRICFILPSGAVSYIISPLLAQDNSHS